MPSFANETDKTKIQCLETSVDAFRKSVSSEQNKDGLINPWTAQVLESALINPEENKLRSERDFYTGMGALAIDAGKNGISGDCLNTAADRLKTAIPQPR